MRASNLQTFLDTALQAFHEANADDRAERSLQEITSRLTNAKPAKVNVGKRLPVCDLYLDELLAVEIRRPLLCEMVQSFRLLEDALEWKTRASGTNASENFPEQHAYTMIVGPGGLEDRADV